MKSIVKANTAFAILSIVIICCPGCVPYLTIPGIAGGLGGTTEEQEEELTRRVIAKLGLDGPEEEFIEGLEKLGFTPLSPEASAEFDDDWPRSDFDEFPPRYDLLRWRYADYSIGVFPCDYSWRIYWRELDGTILYVGAGVRSACL